MNRKEYLSSLKILKSLLPEGVKVRFTYLRDHKNNKNLGHGIYHTKNKRIRIYIFGKKCRKQYQTILALLAHEVRHAQHHAEGLFEEYYSKKFDEHLEEYVHDFLIGKETLPDLKVGQKAERDCDKFAIDFMKAIGFPLDPGKGSHLVFFKPYPKQAIRTYPLRQALERINVLQSQAD